MKISLFPVVLANVWAVQALIDLKSAGSFGVLSLTSITSTGSSVITGDLGTTGNSITGFPPGVFSGTKFLGSTATTARNDAFAAYNAISSNTGVIVLTGNLGGRVLAPGTYKYASAAQLTGLLILSGTGSPTDAWYFQIGSTLVTSASASITLVGGAKPCNIFWKVGSSATIGVGTQFSGNILAQVSITMNAQASSNGGLFALGGAVTMNNNKVTAQYCGNTATPSSSSSSTLPASSTLSTLSSESATSSSSVVSSYTSSSSASSLTSSSDSSSATTTSEAPSSTTTSLASSSESLTTTTTSEASSSTTTSLASSSESPTTTTTSDAPLSTTTSADVSSSLTSSSTVSSSVDSTSSSISSSSTDLSTSSTSTTVSSTESSTTTSSTTISISTSPTPSSVWEYSGCYTETKPERALTGASFASDQLTVERCATFCSSFSIFGVEYGRECYCGNVLKQDSVSVLEGDCNFKCAGSSTENCGAGDRLNIYKKPSAATPSPTTSATPLPTSYRTLGCYSEATNSRALNQKSSSDDAMTIQKCAASCAGYKYFGLEYYFECFCGNELQPGSVEVATTDCKFPCSGDQSQICGANSRLNLYAFGEVPAPPTPVSSSTTSIASPSATPYPGYTTTGCYTEATNMRALSEGRYYDDNMTIGTCALACSGFSLFGVEYGRECYCGNALNSGSVAAPTEECSFACPGNKAEFCGAGNRLNVYQYGPPPAAPTI